MKRPLTDPFPRFAQIHGLVASRGRPRSVDTVFAVGDIKPAMQAGIGNPEVLRNLSQRRFTLAGNGDPVSAELGRKCFRHGLILPARTNPHRSGVN
jgi:hypothetical protein